MDRYRRLGFAVIAASLMAAVPMVVTAQDARSLKIDGVYYDELVMQMRLAAS